MFSQILTTSLLALAIFTGSTEATPVRHVTRYYPKFSNWHGIGSLHNFDDFYGRHNYDGHRNRQVIIKKQKELVCRRVDVKIIQQRLVVIQELAKRIISQQICEVETQTIVFQQWHAGLGHFKRDIHRRSGKKVGYDEHIAGLYSRIFRDDGELSDDDLGFKGIDVGSQVVVPSGSNWDDERSPPIIDSAQDAADAASAGADNSGIFEVNDTGDDADVEGQADVTGAAVPPPPTVTGAAVPPPPTATGADIGIAGAANGTDTSAAAAPTATAAGGEVAGANVGGAAGRRR